jgi:hypothetical protein
MCMKTETRGQSAQPFRCRGGGGGDRGLGAIIDGGQAASLVPCKLQMLAAAGCKCPRCSHHPAPNPHTPAEAIGWL